MVLKSVFAALLCTTLLAWNGAAAADEYRPDEFLKLDLPKAALSPKPLGPPSRFEPLAVEAKTEPKTEPAPKVAPAREAKVTAVRAVKVTPVRTAKRNPAVRTKLAHRHSNPLDAQAFDTRIQVWPCRSGGICNWRPSGN